MQDQDKDLQAVASALGTDEFYYVSVNTHFTTIRKIQFSQVFGDFYGSGRLSFTILKSFRSDTKDGDYIRLHIRDVETDFHGSFDEAVKAMRSQIERVLGYDYGNMATRSIIGNEVNRRFGEALNNYFLSTNPTKRGK